MQPGQINECLRIVTDAMLTLEAAKDDFKAVTDSAFETYELTPDQIKAIRQVAKAKISGKLEVIDQATQELSAMIEAVK